MNSYTTTDKVTGMWVTAVAEMIGRRPVPWILRSNEEGDLVMNFDARDCFTLTMRGRPDGKTEYEIGPKGELRSD